MNWCPHRREKLAQASQNFGPKAKPIAFKANSQTVYNFIHLGKLQATYVGKTARVRRSNLETFLEPSN